MRLSGPVAVLAAVLTLSLLGSAPAGAAAPGPNPAGTGRPGTPVGLSPLPAPLRLADAGAAWRLRYVSTSWTGRPTVVSGTLTLPPGRPPAGGWPVVSFGHGFGGVADRCAPSRTGPSPWERTLTETLLAGGHAIAVTDYEGVGTPGESSLVHGRAEAYSMIDIVRAARWVAPVSRTWAAVGYSLGGHAALFAASLARTYAPALRHVGTIALAPVTQWGVQLASPLVRDPQAPVGPTVPFSGYTLDATGRGGYHAADWHTPRGLELVALAGRVCIDEMAAAVAGLTNADVFGDPAAAADEFGRLLAAEEVPVARYPRPVRLVHGTADQLLIVLTGLTTAQLAAAGTDVEFTPVPGADHLTLLPTVAPQVLRWTTELFGSRSAGSSR